MIKDKDYYRNIDYDIIVSKLSEEDGGGYFAYYKDFKGVMGDGETKDDAIDDVKKAFESFVEVSISQQTLICEPNKLSKAKKINITIPEDKLINLDIFAKKLNINRSKLITALADKLLNGDIRLDVSR